MIIPSNQPNDKHLYILPTPLPHLLPNQCMGLSLVWNEDRSESSTAWSNRNSDMEKFSYQVPEVVGINNFTNKRHNFYNSTVQAILNLDKRGVI